MKKLFVGTMSSLAVLLAPALALAENAASGEWETVHTAMVQPGEGFEASTLVAAAYAFIWIMVAGFVLATWLRAGRLDRDIDELRRRVERAKGAAGSSG
jgi:hypothetical protein